MSVNSLLTNPKTSSVVSTSTVASGLGTWIDLIPNDIGKVASLVGLILTLIVMYCNLLKNAREEQKWQIEKRLLESGKSID